MGAALCSNGKNIVKETKVQKKRNPFQSNESRDDDVSDKDHAGFDKSNIARTHEKLWQAVELNDQAAAEKYLDFNEVNEQNLYDPFGQTMLHKAASTGAAEMLMLLIERTGAKPDLVNGSLATPLHIACRNGRDNVVKFLIGCGVEVNTQDEHGQTPLLISCIHGHKEITSMLVEASNSGHLLESLEIDLPNHQGLTPLNCAAIKGDLEMVKCLVSRGGANINQTSPKGCTPLIYAGRGGYSAVVEYLIEKKASALKQDNAGGTVLHHAIEKGHIHVLEMMLALGVDIYSAIEIADNAGRTPLFEAVENLNGAEQDAASIKIIKILTKSRAQNGFGANPNVVNYNGQTPLFSAARQGSMSAVTALFEAGARPDLNNGELVKPEDDQEQDDDDDESVQEKFFMDAFKNCMTPLQVAVVLGYDDIALFLVQECKADPNLQTRTKGLTTLHLSVLAHKPEMIMQLLTKADADPLIEDRQGRTLLDMVYQYMPAYLETFEQILQKLAMKRLKQYGSPTKAKTNLDDERKITGAKTQQEITDMYAKQMEVIQEEGDHLSQTINLAEILEDNLMSDSQQIDPHIERVFGAKIALCLVSQNWQHKEQALKYIIKATEKFLAKQDLGSQGTPSCSLSELVQGCLAAVSLTCRDKVIKVFNISLQLFNILVQSSRIEHDMRAMGRLLSMLNSEKIVEKLLLQSEQSNTRVTNKIHESILDMSYQPQIGEDIACVAVLEQIRRHNQQNMNHKGLLAQLALLYKLVNTFKIQTGTHELDDPKALFKDTIIEVVLPSCSHTKDDIRGAAIKILIDIQQHTGALTQADFQRLPEKIRENVWEKISNTPLNHGESPVKETQKKVNIVNLEIDANPESVSAVKLTAEALDKYKKIINEKGAHKDWTQREIALNALQECFNLDIKDYLDQEEEFLVQCSILLQTSLDENNIQIYLIAIEVISVFIQKAQNSEALLDALPSLLQTIVLRTTDTNTRVRKRSVEVINQVWDVILNKKANLNASQMVANVLCDPALNEKAIVGRLGLFIKKALLIESSQDISKKPLQLILGKDYEQIAQFACQWCLHKNTKVRQCALKLAVEICRLNCIDPRGQPFKQRIINLILGLRASIRDPLVKKINEVCLQANPQLEGGQYVNETELDLALATKTRAASYDVRRQLNRVKTPSETQIQQTLPSIGGLPQMQQIQNAGSRPTIVLPHSEPLSDTQKEQAAQLIELFGCELITCFYSQTWSSRYAAIQKVEEQLHNLDPRRRDAMSGEINRNNQPPELSFKIVLKFFEEGLKDPVLKNYITILELIQSIMPIFFRYLRAEQIKREISPLILIIINKTSDLKQKVREASMNFCLYLSHQVEIGCEHMLNLVLSELDSLQWDKQDVKKDVQNTFGNSNMIVSCLNLLAQFQLQTLLVTQNCPFYSKYAMNINKALKHSNPQVRKEAEALFKIMFATFQDAYVKELKDQKPQLVLKLVAESKAESVEKKNESSQSSQTKDSVAEQEQQKTFELKDDYLNQPSIMQLLKGNEDKLQQLKLPNPKKRLIAIVEIKKAIQQKLTQITPQTARDLVEPLSFLLRHLLRDENVDVYLEALNLVKFIVGNLAQHLSALDLHLMMGQFIAVIVAAQNQNMRARVASDKVIVYFAKHTNIGSLVVAKEVLKNIERLNKTAFIKSSTQIEDTEEKKQVLARFYGILTMMLQQFSIVLCYQPEFYSKCLDLLSDTMSKSVDEPFLKSTCTQQVVSLHQIDAKLLEQGVASLDFTKKTHLKKILIELENSSQKGLINQNQNLVSGVGGTSQRTGSPDASFRDTQQSFTSLNSRGSVMSPSAALNMNRRLQRDRISENRASKDINIQETPDQWRRPQNEPSHTGVGWLERKNTDQINTINLPQITQIKDSGSGTTRRRQIGQGFVGGSSKAAGFNRNDFNNTGEYTNNRKVLGNDFGISNGIGTNILTSVANKPDFDVNKPLKNQEIENEASRAPLYVPTQRMAQKKQEGYQPTIIQRQNSQNNQQPAVERYKPLISQAQTSSSFGISQVMATTTSTQGQQEMRSAAKQQLPPAATTSVVQRKNSLY